MQGGNGILQGSSGEYLEESSDQKHYLGTPLIYADGRRFRYALMGGTVGVAGNCYQGVSPVANHLNTAADVARAAGATQISSTLGGTAAAIDIYTEGIAHINNEAGEGITYTIQSILNGTAGDAHAAASSSAVLTVNLTRGLTVKVALTTSSRVTYTRNKWHALVIAASTVVAATVGVAPHAVTADYYHWSQEGGLAAVLTDGTVVIGQHVRTSDATAGSVEALDRDGTHENEQAIGVVHKVNATTEYSLIDLTISG